MRSYTSLMQVPARLCFSMPQIGIVLVPEAVTRLLLLHNPSSSSSSSPLLTILRLAVCVRVGAEQRGGRQSGSRKPVALQRLTGRRTAPRFGFG